MRFPEEARRKGHHEGTKGTKRRQGKPRQSRATPEDWRGSGNVGCPSLLPDRCPLLDRLGTPLSRAAAFAASGGVFPSRRSGRGETGRSGERRSQSPAPVPDQTPVPTSAEAPETASAQTRDSDDEGDRGFRPGMRPQTVGWTESVWRSGGPPPRGVSDGPRPMACGQASRPAPEAGRFSKTWDVQTPAAMHGSGPTQSFGCDQRLLYAFRG